ncbi:hypothetical protein CYMTET_45239 [Cymbomonas tetramitiformis]|uniref:HAT C-terminal dimerisation domain-containing protein n=1 Tax=Cymbomonas tetramitiformis TaxID=36881 RepID=A0AAE0C0F0_9CHLO|nr:hypothetical protein CYMTET_45239 [Cymbomonas tetramitiformis]
MYVACLGSFADNDGFEEADGGRRRAACWKLFRLQKDENGKVIFVKCILCGPESRAIPFSGCATNMRTHLSFAHKDAYCTTCAPASPDGGDDGDGDPPAASESNTGGGQDSGRQGSLEAFMLQISSEQRDMLHLKISRWLVRCRRPLSLPEADAEFREVFDLIFKGSYKPPSYNLVVQYVLKLSQQGKSRLITQLAALLEEGILPSLGGDIWSQGGIAIFGILVYWLDENFCIQERLLGALPFSEQRHTAEELEKATKQACAEFGLGEYRNDSSGLVDTVAEYIHATASDNAANIVCGLHSFDGHECANHTVSLIAKTFLDQPNVRKVFMKLRGMTTHFNHSVIGAKLLQECQRKHGLSQSKPPQDNDTRTGWGGACKQAIWFIHNQIAVQMYDVDRPVKAANAVANPDGSVYRTHQLVGVDWDIVRESCYVLQYCKNACDLLQGSKYVTSNLLLPVIGRMAYISHKDTPLKFEKENVKVLNEDVKEARELLYKETCKRYFNDLADCKLEDFAVATVFDPRYKLFNFKFANRFMRGNFSAEVATKRATKAWVADWKPTPAVADTPEPSAKKQKVRGREVVTVANFLGDSDDEEDLASTVEPQEMPVDEDELDLYLSYPVAKADVDPQEWWRVHKSELPNLSKMVRQFWGAPASTAGVERAFSAVTDMHSDLRRSLQEGTIQHSLMAAMNT